MNTQDMVLSYLGQHPGATTAELAQGLKLSPAVIGTALWNLSALNKIHREQHVRGSKQKIFRNYVASGVIPPAPAPEVSNPAVVVATPAVSQPVRPTPPVLGDAIAACIDQLADTLADQISIRLEGVLTVRLAQLVQDLPQTVSEIVASANEPEPEPEVVVPGAPKKKKVVVCGLWDALHRFIIKEFKSCFELTLLNPDEHPSRVTASSKNADHVIIMTSYVRHHFSECAIAAGAKPIQVTGSLSALRKKLTELYIES